MRSENDEFGDNAPAESVDSGPPVQKSTRSPRGSSRVERQSKGSSLRHTRTSAAWFAVVLAVLFGVALVDFIAQNTRDVRVDFFSVSGRVPVAVALLCAALAGAIVVVGVGVGRVAQLRLGLRRERRRLLASQADGDNVESARDEGDETGRTDP